ncbi:hypothetical protein AMAG_03096 [Allomyces macrogynus ATCC 38327]|uniref:Uncharacterized protein n=1 Tax=Allomyces macrogynus (strain ATCC 38327) TaxID=578462 RepID=A0A0L0S4R6_ALLM3|nr:hypothetical protein AMAG_03096 [Allomyces macrogynus ATCC 38327]|eukprot:KNE57374.1 hypothetical protein AMAG_03096 [Allomyces macrogynus ATCC 38327]
MVAQLSKQAEAVSALSKPSQRARDTALSLCVDSPWEDYLSPAPMCIALLGQLQLVATKRDFSIKESAPIGGFQYVKFPDSFRACLVQVTNDGWCAFNTAHTNMNSIRLLAMGMPDKIETVFKILVLGGDKDVQIVLPDVLKSVSRNAVKCETLAKAVDAQFSGVMMLANELLAVCTNQKGVSEQKLREAEATRQATEIMAAELDKQKELQRKQVEELKEMSKNADQLFKETVGKMPSGWDMLGMNMVESIGKTVCNAADRLLNMGVPMLLTAASPTAAAQLGTGGVGAQPQEPATGAAGAPNPKLAKMWQKAAKDAKTAPLQIPAAIDKALDVADQLLGAVQALFALDPSTGTPKGATTDSTAAAGQGPAFIVAILANTIKMLTEMPQTQVAIDELDIAKKASDLATRIQKINGQMNKDDKELAQLAAQAEQLVQRQQAYGAMAKVSRSRELAPTTSPGMYQTMTKAKGLSAAEMQQRNWQASMEATQSAARDAHDRFDKQFTALQEMQTRHAKLMAEMSQVKVDEINFAGIIDVLKKGIMAISELRAQWQSLCRFFSNLVTIVETCNENIKCLTETSSNYAKIRLSDGSTLDKLGRDVVFDLCVKSDAVARVVEMISGTYVEVSTKFIMRPLTELGKIAALDAGKDSAEIQRLQKGLLKDMAAAQGAIVDLVLEKKEGFKAEIHARTMQVDKTLSGLIPPPPAEIKKQIQEAQKVVENERETIKQEKEEIYESAGLANLFS